MILRCGLKKEYQMEALMTEGKNREDVMMLEDGKLTIFSSWGAVDLDGAMVIQASPDVVTKIVPRSIKEGIENRINMSIRRGNGDRLYSICIQPSAGVMLFLKGEITEEDIGNAEVEDARIVFRDIAFNTTQGVMLLPVIVRPDSSYFFVTVDENDHVV
jgi:hypothetical protein